VVPIFNHVAETQEMLASLQASLPSDLAYEIILADDASTDGTVAWLKTLSDPRIRVQLNPTNVGFAANNNAAVSASKGEILALLNNDLIFEAGWLEPMLSVLCSPELNAGIVGNLQNRVSDGSLDHAGVVLTPSAQFHHLRTTPDRQISHTKVLAITGACMVLRRADFEKVGGFDEQFINGCEDIDLCFKIRQTGKSIQVATQSTIRHHVSLSRKANTIQNLRNSRYLFSQWRKEIKRELSDVWRKLLVDPATSSQHLSGELSPEFLSAPYTAATVIAETMLKREEREWAHQLDDKPPKTFEAPRLTWQGLEFSAEMNGHVLTTEAQFIVEGIDCARDFYVCGRRLHSDRKGDVIDICVNDIQRLKIPLTKIENINVGIIGPLLLAHIPNTFQSNELGTTGPKSHSH
jgi:GT2 family glycosyltransferase